MSSGRLSIDNLFGADPSGAVLADLETELAKNAPIRAAEREVINLAVAWHASIGVAAAQRLYESVSALLQARAQVAVPTALPTDPTGPLRKGA